MVTGLYIRGPFQGPTGYDTHTREFVRALTARKVPIHLEHLEGWTGARLAHEFREPWFEALDAPIEVSSALHFTLPTMVAPGVGVPNVNFTMFEATRIPAAWVRAYRLADIIVLPTEHSRRAWIDSGIPEERIRMCPLGVRVDRFRPGVPPLELVTAAGRPVSSYARRFLNVSELGPRKNLVGLMSTWLRATSRQDDAILVMKVACYGPGSRAQFDDDVRAAEARAGRSLDVAAPIHFVFDMLPDADMPRLFAAGTHYIGLSFGEGWDLSMSQAAAAGLRLIAPRHSAYLEYLDDDVATLVSTREMRANLDPRSWAYELFADASWWIPDEDEAVEHIRAAVRGDDTPRASARDRMRERYTWDLAAARLFEIIEEAEAMFPTR